jgi:flagellar basal-body rod modification protein FlgD
MSIISNVTSDSPTNVDPTATQPPSYRNGITVAASNGVDPLANKNVFLNLLVAQIKNQDPLNPTDGSQFVAQLAQFSQLEQTMAMRQSLDGIKTDLDSATAPPVVPPPVVPPPVIPAP